MRSTLLFLALLSLFTASLRADIIFGNLSGFTNDNGQSGGGTTISPTSGKAIGFTMAAASYELTSVTLRLRNIAQVGTDVPLVRLYTNAAGIPGTSLGTLTNPAFVNQTTATNYVFTPAASITLNAGVSYFIVVLQAASSSPDLGFNWLNGDPTVTPTSAAGIATTPTAVFGSSNNPGTWSAGSTSGNYNWFQIDGTLAAVPEPGSFATLAGAAVLALGCFVRSRRRA